jgi:hypothetical protein
MPGSRRLRGAGLRELGWDPGRDIDVLRAGAGTLEDIGSLLLGDPEVLVTGGAVRIVHAAQAALTKSCGRGGHDTSLGQGRKRCSPFRSSHTKKAAPKEGKGAA